LSTTYDFDAGFSDNFWDHHDLYPALVCRRDDLPFVTISRLGAKDEPALTHQSLRPRQLSNVDFGMPKYGGLEPTLVKRIEVIRIKVSKEGGI
jgi:hypothetical protein